MLEEQKENTQDLHNGFLVEPIERPNRKPRKLNVLLTHPRLILGGFVVLVLIVLVLIFLFRSPFSNEDVELLIEGPSEIKAGQLIEFKVKYENKTDTPLGEARLTFFYPQDAKPVKDGEVKDINSESVEIGDISTGKKEEVVFSAFIAGDRGNIKTARAILFFKLENLNSEFKKEATFAATITETSVQITLVAPPTVVNNQNISYILDYRNQSNEDLAGLRFKMRYPDSFSPLSLSPRPDKKDGAADIWNLPVLKKSEGGRITVTGLLSGNEGEAKTAIATLERQITTPAGEIFIDFQKSEVSSVISKPLLSVNVALNDSTDYIARAGDLLRYKILVKNNTSAGIKNLNLYAKLEGSMFDFASIRTNGFFDGQTGVISWSGAAEPALSNLRANDSAVLEFEVRLNENFSGGIGARESFVKVGARLETFSVPPEFDLEKLVAEEELTTRISTSLTFNQSVLVNDPRFQREGPFPPEVNRKTIFTIKWGLANPANDVSPAVIGAILPSGIVWENQTEVSGNAPPLIQYDDRTRTIVWDLGGLPAGIGTAFPIWEISFRVSTTPSINQVGESITLLKEAKFEGSDSFTKEKMIKTVSNATTSNVADSKENGIVK